MERHAEILECRLLAGPADDLIRVASADAADFEHVHATILTRRPGVTRLQSAPALRTGEKTTAPPIRPPRSIDRAHPPGLRIQGDLRRWVACRR